MVIKAGYKYRWSRLSSYFVVTKIENDMVHYYYPEGVDFARSIKGFDVLPHPENKLLEFNELLDQYYGD